MRRLRLHTAGLPSSRAIRAAGLTAGTIVAACAAAGPAQALVPPGSPADVTVHTSGGWTVALHGPDTGAEQQTVSTEITLTNPQGALEYVLYPEIDLTDQGCRPNARRNCLPARAIKPAIPLVGNQGLVAIDNGLVLPPTVVVQMKRSGDYCCQLLSGYVPDGEGAYDNSTINGGSARQITKDRTTRFRIGNPAWERLDWTRSAYQQNYRWMSLDPTQGWTDRTETGARHAEIARLQRFIRRTHGSQQVRSARAVIIAQRAGLGQKASLKRAVKSYGRIYGARRLARLVKQLAIDTGAVAPETDAPALTRSAPTRLRPAAPQPPGR